MTKIRQDTQVRSSDVYDDTLATGPTLESAATSVEDDLNALRTQVNTLLNLRTASWYDDIATPGTFENGAQRGVNLLNEDLHTLERQRVLVAPPTLVSVTVGGAANYVVLPGPSLPPMTTLALDATTLGTVAAYVAGFGAHSLTVVNGTTALTPKNLCKVVSATTRDPILSSDRVIYALLQSESNTDESPITATTPNRVQLSFVRINALGTGLEAVPTADIQGQAISYLPVQRKALRDLLESDFLWGALFDVDVAAGGGITEAEHENLDTLVHKIAETSFLEYVYDGNGKLTEVITWTDSGKTLRIRDSTLTYTGNAVTTTVARQYNALGVVIATLTKTLSYTGDNVASIDVVRS